ncbi:BAHD acyltransferase [Nymphaea thermarum]|nr:BAHD acyltransferase [Nymphaea thermarum]
MVVPAVKAAKETCPLLTFDLPYVTFYYNQKVLLYKVGAEEGEFEKAVETLEKSLAEVLGYFYPLAGKLVQDEEGVLEVDCNDRGAEFVVAAAEDVHLSELAASDASPLLQDVVPYAGVQNHEGRELPLLAVQASPAIPLPPNVLPSYSEGVPVICVPNLSRPSSYSRLDLFTSVEWCAAAASLQLACVFLVSWVHLIATSLLLLLLLLLLLVMVIYFSLIQIQALTAEKWILSIELAWLPPNFVSSLSCDCVQVTKLKDGMALGCSFNHVILDGNSTWHFMSSWAELARGLTTVSLLPFHDRTKARNTRLKLDLPPLTAHVANGDGPAHQNGEVKPPSKPMREKIFHFSEEVLDKIKAQVNAHLEPDQKPFSSFQALGVHVWRSVIRARELPPESYTVFTLFVDCRKRLEPPMSDNFFGNLIQGIYTVTASGMLLAQPAEYGAGLLHELINSHNAAAIDAKSTEWEKAPKLYNYKDAGINCVAVGSSPRFKVYEVDFGWGSPDSVRSGSNNKFDGMMYLYAGKKGGRSVDAEITLEAETMKKLEADEQFLTGSAV